MKNLNYNDILKQAEAMTIYNLNSTSREFKRLPPPIEPYFDDFGFIVLIPSWVKLSDDFKETKEDNPKSVFAFKLKQEQTYTFLAVDSKKFTAKVKGILETMENLYLVLELNSKVRVFRVIDEDGICTGLHLLED